MDDIFEMRMKNLDNEPSIKIYNCDNTTGMNKHLTDNSIDLTVTSIPFGSLFTYSGLPEDIGNNHDGNDLLNSQFGLHLRFHIKSLFRVMKDGCNVCIHIQQLLRYQNEHGYIGRRDFRGALIELMCNGGFEYKGEVVIPKNPQLIAQRLKLHSLMFITGKRDARQLAPAVNDYMIIFQKPGKAEPVKAIQDNKINPNGWMSATEWINWARGVWQNEDLKLKNGSVDGLFAKIEENSLLNGYDEATKFFLDNEWIISGVWDDMRETDVLDNWRHGRDQKDEKHVCPLQLEVIRRCIKLYSNPSEIILDPFNGIGSTTWVAAEQGRHSVGFELKESYYNISIKNMKNLNKINAQMSLI